MNKRIRDLQKQLSPLMTDVIPVDRDGNIEAQGITIQQLVNMFNSNAAAGASGFVAIPGTVLPNITDQSAAYSFIGLGTFTQTTGGSIQTTQLLNVIGWNGTTWVLVFAIPLSLAAYMLKADYNFAGPYDTVALANQAITNAVGSNGKNNRDAKIVFIGTGGSYTLYWWKGGFADTNLVGYLDEINAAVGLQSTTLTNKLQAVAGRWAVIDTGVAASADAKTITVANYTVADTTRKWAGNANSIYTPAKTRIAVCFRGVDLGGTNLNLNFRILIASNGSAANQQIINIPYSQAVGYNVQIIDLPAGFVGAAFFIYYVFNSSSNAGLAGLVNFQITDLNIIEVGNAGDPFYGFPSTQLRDQYSKLGYFYPTASFSFNKLLNTDSVVNSLTSTDPALPLSAAQGKILNDGTVKKTDIDTAGTGTAGKVADAVIVKGISDALAIKSYTLTNKLEAIAGRWVILDTDVVPSEDAKTITLANYTVADGTRRWAGNANSIYTPSKTRIAVTFNGTDIGGTNLALNFRVQINSNGSGANPVIQTISYAQAQSFNVLIFDLPTAFIGTNFFIYFIFNSSANAGLTGLINFRISDLNIIELGSVGDLNYGLSSADIKAVYSRIGYFYPTYLLSKANISANTSIVDNLTSTDPNSALSAKQGKVLADKLIKPYAGKKLVTIGDSLTAGILWQQYLCDLTGMVWSINETVSGTGGNPPMAIGGTAMAPFDSNSIFMRLFYAKNYNPDVIILYAGQNDANVGTINDTPYTTNAANPAITMAAAMMGGIEILMRDCPNAKVFVVTQMRLYAQLGTVTANHDFSTMDKILAFEQPRFAKAMLIKAIAEKYSLPCIDLWHNSGINNYNAAPYYQEPDPGNNAQVHFNSVGGRALALCANTYF
jgi:hypothetical protein